MNVIAPQDLSVLRTQAAIIEQRRVELEMLEFVFRRNLEAARLRAEVDGPFVLDLEEGVFRPVEEPEDG